MNVQAMPQYDYPAYDEYGDIIQPFERPPVGTCSLPADLGGTGKKTHCTLKVLIDFCQVLSEFLTWSFELSKLLIFCQKLLWNIRSRLNRL